MAQATYTPPAEQIARRAALIEGVTRAARPHAYPCNGAEGPPDLRPSWMKLADALVASGKLVASLDRRVERVAPVKLGEAA